MKKTLQRAATWSTRKGLLGKSISGWSKQVDDRSGYCIFPQLMAGGLLTVHAGVFCVNPPSPSHTCTTIVHFYQIIQDVTNRWRPTALHFNDKAQKVIQMLLYWGRDPVCLQSPLLSVMIPPDG